MNEIVNVITPFMMWLSDPQTIPAIINAIKGWYHWRQGQRNGLPCSGY